MGLVESGIALRMIPVEMRFFSSASNLFLYLAHLLIQIGMWAFQTCAHTPGPKPILRDIPHAIGHRIKHIIAVRRAEAECPGADIVAERVAHQWRGERAEVLRDQEAFGLGDAALDDLLRCPGPVLVHANHGEMRRYALQHSYSDIVRYSFEQPLNDGVADMIRCKLDISYIPRQALTSAVSSSSSRAKPSTSSWVMPGTSRRFRYSFRRGGSNLFARSETVGMAA